MSIHEPPTDLSHLVELLLPEERSHLQIYQRLQQHQQPTVPTLITDMLDMAGEADHEEPFDEQRYGTQEELDVLPPALQHLSLAEHHDSSLSMEIQQEPHDDLGQIALPQDLYMLSDPERPSYDEYQFLSPYQREPTSPLGVLTKPVEERHPEERTPTKSSSTEIEIEHMAPIYSQETREDKLRRYLCKRHNRNWNRKVSYDCRKKVADSRLRIKGRFITRAQAEVILGQPVSMYSSEEVKMLLERHFAGSKQLSSPDLRGNSLTSSPHNRKPSVISQQEAEAPDDLLSLEPVDG